MSTSLTQAVPFDIILVVIFTGAFAFVMFAATWLIVERNRLENVETTQAQELADLRAANARSEALLDVPDQRLVIWDEAARDQPPLCRGLLPPSSGAPLDEAGFIAFGTWLTPASSKDFEHAVARLRGRAEAFDLTVETRTGTHLDVMGRTSGSAAFVRFLALDGVRANAARLERDYTALLATAETLHGLLEAIPEPVWMRDREGTLTWGNPAFLNAIEVTDFEQAVRHKTRLLDAPTREKLDDQLSQGISFHGRYPATMAGDRRTVNVHAVGAAQGASAGIAIDMSEVDTVRRNLNSALASHRATLDQLATAIAIFDERKGLAFHNAAFATLWGLAPSDLEDGPDNARLLDTLRAKGKVAERADWAKWRDGWIDVYASTEPRQDWWYLPDGRTLRVVATPQEQGGVAWLFENMTEQLAMESRVTALHKVQGETLDHMGEGIAVFSPSGRLRLSNPAFQKMWRLDDEQVAGETSITALADHVRQHIRTRRLGEDSGDVWDEIITTITGMSDTRERVADRIQLTGADGESVHDFALVPLPDGETMISFADVTDTVRMETVLTERNAALQAAERLKNAFFQHVSYELRTPLTSIKGFADVLAEGGFGPLNPKQAEYVSDIADASRELERMVDNLLDLAIVDAGRLELDLERTDLREVLAEATRSVGDLLRDKGVKLAVKSSLPQGKAAEIVADTNRLQQVLFNLLANAVRFSQAGEEIVLEARIEGDEAVIAVADTGPGVPEAQRETIFERFEGGRVGGATDTPSSGGAGLGLAIARSMIQLHEGSIALDDEYAEGARFVCRLPRALSRPSATV